MKSKARVLGIDLGTSAIKLFATGDAPIEVRAAYDGQDIAQTLRRALSELFLSVPSESIESLGFSGQTGTYHVIDEGRVASSIRWHEAGREAALERALALLPESDFIALTGMRHPRLASYPLPTILYLCEKNRLGQHLMQPKDYVIWHLSGAFVSDAGSWRGLVNPLTADFDPKLLALAGISRAQLPTIAPATRVSREGARVFGLREGTPIAVGFNDFYAALYGAFVEKPGDCFDITGTSEHFGVVADALGEARMTESPYLNGTYVRYGVTASSGVSLNWCRQTFGEIPLEPVCGAPLFLPYLRGERQPDCDASARGMFVGLGEHTDNRALCYSVAEGVALSIYRLYEALGFPPVGKVLATGGGTAPSLINRMKASLIGAPLVVLKPDCGSALGAVRAAGGHFALERQVFEPEPWLGDYLFERYRIYRKMYAAWREMTDGADAGRLFGKDDGTWLKH